MESDLSSDDEVTTIGAGDSDVEQINSGGDWRLPIKETDVNRRFFIEFIDGRKTTRRKCRDCGCVIESSGNTTNMRKHIRSCKKRMVSNQGILPFKVGAPEKKGYSIIAKLVYVDNFPITKVANSAQLKTMFEKLNYDKVTYQSLNCYLEELYHRAVSKMKSILAQRSKADLMSITFDKWTAIGDNKFIGVYVYHKVTKYCLGLIHYEGVCRSSDIINHKDQCQNSSEFDIIDALDGFIPANVDAERLFSWGRLSKNYLQCQMSPDNHSRNVFLNKCQHLIWCKTWC